jgi:hypothetical protein
MSNVARPERPPVPFHERAVGFGDQTVGRKASNQVPVLRRSQHLAVGGEIAAEGDCTACFCRRARKPVQDDATTVLRQRTFDMVEHFARRADAVNGQYFSALFCASAQDAFKHSLLCREAAVEVGAGIQTDLADIARIREVAFEDGQFVLALGDELWVKAKCDTNMGGLRR